MSRGQRLAELGRMRYVERQREEMLANIPWSQGEGQNQEIMEDDNREDIESASEHSEHNTDSEQSDDEIENFVQEIDEKTAYATVHHFTGKDKKFHWMAHPPRPNVRTPRKNIVSRLPGVKNIAKNANSVESCWRLYITEEMVEQIVQYTNIYLAKLRNNYSRERDCRDTDTTEVYAFIGLLYMAGTRKAQYVNTKELWDNSIFSPACFRLTMSRERFHLLDYIDPELGELQKPEIVTFYNLTKGGVDVVDEMKSTYSVSRFCCRWPLRIFFTILDVAAINSNIVYKSNTGVIEERRIYLNKLAEALIKPLLVRRSSIRSLPINIRSMLREYLNLPQVEQNREASSDFCAFCPRRKNRKSKKRCVSCNAAICTEHTTFTCRTCCGVNQNSDSSNN
nr:unnamed protein product [Callosobruchus analis]